MMAQISACLLLVALCLALSANYGLASRELISNEEHLNSEKQAKEAKHLSISYVNGSMKAAPNKTLLSQDEGGNKGGLFVEEFSMQELTRNKSASNIRSNDNEVFLNHWAVIQQVKGEYFGTKATLNVYGLPEVGQNQISEVIIWVVNGYGSSPDNFNAIKAGWHVHPKLYGDHDTHFFVYWTVDSNYKTGCYNMKCRGFVLVKSSRYVPGTIIRPLSTYKGKQYFITLRISTDQVNGGWWLHAGRNGDSPVGYWPKSLFTSLAESASYIEWGWVVGFHKDEKGPPMGSGHFPSAGESGAASLSDVRLESRNGELYDPEFFPLEDKPGCYKILEQPFHLFGGPGGCIN